MSNIVFNPSIIKILMQFLLFGYYILVYNKEIQLFCWIGLGQAAEYSNSLCYKKAFLKGNSPPNKPKGKSLQRRDEKPYTIKLLW